MSSLPLNQARRRMAKELCGIPTSWWLPANPDAPPHTVYDLLRVGEGVVVVVVVISTFNCGCGGAAVAGASCECVQKQCWIQSASTWKRSFIYPITHRVAERK